MCYHKVRFNTYYIMDNIENLIDDFLSLLSKKQRLIFSLHYGLNDLGTNWSIQDIADYFGVSYHTIYDQLNSIHSKLKYEKYTLIIESLCCH